MLSIAAAIHDDLALGDVVVAAQIDAYLATSKAVPRTSKKFGLEFRGEVYKATHSLIQETIHLPFSSARAYERWQRACSVGLRRMASPPNRKCLIDSKLLRRKPQFFLCDLVRGLVIMFAQLAHGSNVRFLSPLREASELKTLDHSLSQFGHGYTSR